MSTIIQNTADLQIILDKINELSDAPIADPVIEPLEITENGVYTAPEGIDGYSPITVDVTSSGGTDERFKQLVEGTITEVNDSEITKIKMYGLSNSALKTANLANVTNINDYAFRGCWNLESAFLTSLKTCMMTNLSYAQGVFYECYKLKNVGLPLLQNISTNWFYGCQQLESIDFPSLKSIKGSNAFINCWSLKAVILRSDILCTLATSSAFTYCYHFLGTVNSTYNPEGKKDGYIYVPSALIEEYKVATNWVTFADQFRALEDYTVDGTTTGELDWEKVNAA